jgi:hypothetical protein
MRLGTNPNKDNRGLPAFPMHRIIIPIHIPHHRGYFEHSLEILKLCLESLRLSISGRAAVTLISNGSSPEVVTELRHQYEMGWIDQLLLNQPNRGKVDAIVSVARGAFAELITIADADVMFLPNWLDAIEEIFRVFPECGFASPVPMPGFYHYNTSSVILSNIIQGQLKFQSIVAEDDLERFAQSVGHDPNHEFRKAQIVIQRGQTIACLGAGHFIASFRENVVSAIPKEPSLEALGSADHKWIDEPSDKLGLWRLSTTQAYAYHLGNTPTEWMYDEIEKCRSFAKNLEKQVEREPLPTLRKTIISYLPWQIRRFIIKLIRRFHLYKYIHGYDRSLFET